MLRRILVITIVVMGVFCLNGCKKHADEVQPEVEKVKTTAEYEAEAKEQIDKENMAEELERIDKEMEQDVSQEE